jgi:outer membrane protein OmpA-like peptidoglycan-associated protein
VVADADADGIVDDEDTCPTLKGPADNHGCPATQKQQVVITNNHLQILDKIYFGNASAKLQKRSYRLLDQVAEVIKSHPNIPAVEVAGHTDSHGSPARNTHLSQARAEAVRSYLIEKGVPANKLLAKGYGADKPIDTNLTASGREANRRVEFNFTNSQTVTTQNIPVKAPAKVRHVKGHGHGKTQSAKGTVPAAKK